MNMASKFGSFCCFHCGEFAMATLYDIIDETEVHMCDVTELGDKKQKLLKFRGLIDAEIAKLGRTASTTPTKTPPPPPPPLLSSSSEINPQKSSAPKFPSTSDKGMLKFTEFIEDSLEKNI